MPFPDNEAQEQFIDLWRDERLTRFAAGFVPKLVAANAMGTFGLVGVAYLINYLLIGDFLRGHAGHHIIVWGLAVSSASLPFYTAMAISRVNKIPARYWLQSTAQLVWLAYLAWVSHPSFGLIGVLLLLAAVVNDTRYFYDSNRLRIHYASIAPFTFLCLLLTDAAGMDGLLHRLSTAPSEVAAYTTAILVATLASQFITGVVGGQWQSIDEQLSDNAALAQRLIELRTQREAIMRASDLVLHGLSLGRFSHDVASPLSTLSLSITQMRSVHSGPDAAVLRTRILANMESALKQLSETAESLAVAVRERPPVRERELSTFVQEALEHARRTGAARAGVPRFPVSTDLPPCSVPLSEQHQGALADIISNAARASPKQGVSISGYTPSADILVLLVRDHGKEGEERATALARIERALSLHVAPEDVDSTRREGFGIGLALARLTFLRHGGDVSARAASGAGIEIVISLARVPPEQMTQRSLEFDTSLHQAISAMNHDDDQ